MLWLAGRCKNVGAAFGDPEMLHAVQVPRDVLRATIRDFADLIGPGTKSLPPPSQ